MDQNWNTLPSFITVNPSSGDITLTLPASPSNYYVTIIGIITSSGQAISTSINLISNNPAVFISPL